MDITTIYSTTVPQAAYITRKLHRHFWRLELVAGAIVAVCAAAGCKEVRDWIAIENCLNGKDGLE